MVTLIESDKAIRLDGTTSAKRLEQWKPFKKKGFRILDEDGVTVWHEKEIIKRLVLCAFQQNDADVFLFGSRATDEEHKLSDYDIGYCSSALPPSTVLSTLREQLEELPIPAHVELVDFMDVPKEFSQHVVKTGNIRVWKKRSKNSLFI